MDLIDIAIAKQLAEGGGGSEPTSYNDLSNLPKINGNTLAGDKTASSLGLQDEIDSDNKLSSDLVDDTNATNKFVTEEQKNAWNGKQNTIDSDHKLNADLVDDSNSTNKFVTSSDKDAWNAKQNAIDSEHKLSSSLVSFDTAEAAALASGIDSAKVGQIATNQTNILYTKDMVCDDAFSTSKSYAVGDFTIYDNKLYKFKNTHQGAWSASDVDQISLAESNSDLTQGLAELNAHPFLTIPFNHNMIYRGKNLGDTLTDAQHTALSSGNFTDLYLGDYWTKSVSIPAGTYTDGGGAEVTVPAQTVTLKAVIADFDTFYAGYASSYAGINTHHAAVIITGFNNVVWNSTNTTAGGYVASLIHKWLVGSVLPQMETWFGSAKVLSHQKLLTNAITGDAASGWAWSSQKISLLSENQMYGSKVWGNSKAANGGYEPGEAFKHLNVFNHIDANLLFGNRNIWLRDIASAVWAAGLHNRAIAYYDDASNTWVAPAALILLS